jgi:hypothetical protein
VEELEQFDVSEYSFDEFVSFIFDHESSEDWDKQKPWYWNTEAAAKTYECKT